MASRTCRASNGQAIDSTCRVSLFTDVLESPLNFNQSYLCLSGDGTVTQFE